MRKIYLLGAFLLSITLLRSQTPSLEWQRPSGGSLQERCKVIIDTHDGHLILGGEVWSNDGDVSGNHGGNNADGWLAKFSQEDGSLIWQKCYGGTGGDDISGIALTDDGGYIFVGTTGSNNGDITESNGDYDVYVVKVDADANIEWLKNYGGSDQDGGQKIINTADGGYIVSGYTYSTDGDVTGNNGGLDIWVVKLSNTGVLEWQKALGGSDWEFSSDIIEDTDGYVIIGETDSNDGNVSGNHGLNDAWVVKIDLTGTILWQKCYGGSGEDYGTEIYTNTNGGYTFSAAARSHDGDVTNNNASEFCTWLVDIDNTGSINWEKSYSGNVSEKNYSMSPTKDGGYVLTGESYSDDGSVTGHHGGIDYWNLKVDATGKIEWEQCLGGSSEDRPRSVFGAADGSIFTAGYSNSTDGDISGNQGDFDIWIVKQASTLSVSSNDFSNQFTVYPLPVQNQMYINFGEANQSNYTIRIFDVLGENIFTKNYSEVSNQVSIDVSSFSNGNYFVKIENIETSQVITKKLIKY